MGNITAVIRKRGLYNDGRLNIVDLTFSSSYATGGDSLPANALLGLDGILDYVDLANTSGGYLTFLDIANRKIKLFKQNATTGKLVEETNATNVSAETSRAVVFGDNPNA